MTKKEISAAIHGIRKFVYYSLNYWDMKSVCNTIWGKLLGEHLYGKLVWYDYDFIKFYVNLSVDNQRKFGEWIIENYDGVEGFKSEAEMEQEPYPISFIDYCKEHIEDKIYDMVGNYYYGADLAYELTQEENANGTLTFSAEASKKLIHDYWIDAGEYWEYERFIFGEHSHNPFDSPESYFVCMVIEGCASLLGQTEALQEVWNDKFELTKELADTIVEQANEITKIW